MEGGYGQISFRSRADLRLMVSHCSQVYKLYFYGNSMKIYGIYILPVRVYLIHLFNLGRKWMGQRDRNNLCARNGIQLIFEQSPLKISIATDVISTLMKAR